MIEPTKLEPLQRDGIKYSEAVKYLNNKINKLKQESSSELNLEFLEILEYYMQENEKLGRVAIETGFREANKDCEFLFRRLLAMDFITLKDGMYSRKPFDFEKSFRIDGLLYDKEKIFFLEDDQLDEYTKQLENKLLKLQK